MLLDTSGFFCLQDKTEERHAAAVAHFQKARARLTTSYILAEYVALAHVRGMPREQVVAFSAEILIDERVEIVWVDESLHRQAVSLLEARPDKTYSLCDAVSFIVMRERNITEALTTDQHFEQESLVRLLPR